MKQSEGCCELGEFEALWVVLALMNRFGERGPRIFRSDGTHLVGKSMRGGM